MDTQNLAHSCESSRVARPDPDRHRAADWAPPVALTTKRERRTLDADTPPNTHRARALVPAEVRLDGIAEPQPSAAARRCRKWPTHRIVHDLRAAMPCPPLP
jgi:hypothetical protein